jgi:hypothetical protein
MARRQREYPEILRLRITTSDRVYLEDRAAFLGVSVSDVVRSLIANAIVEQHIQNLERAERTLHVQVES